MSNNKVAPAAQHSAAANVDDKPKVAGGRALASSANLMRLLPSGPVLAFQTLATSFTNQGECLPSNWWLTLGLVTFLTATCIFFSFTDAVKDSDGRVYHGVALPGRLYIFNLSRRQQRSFAAELRKRGLKAVDWVHAFFTAVVFLTIAASDVGLQKCFFPHATDDTKQLLRNLPLGMAVLSSFVFMVFPTKRKGIGFDNSEYSATPDTVSRSSDHDASSGSSQMRGPPATTGNVLQLLPAGAVLAFQALAATFTNQGNCFPSNWWLTLGLVTFLTGACIFFAFTDTVKDKNGNVYHGVALPGRLFVLNATRKELAELAGELKRRRLRAVDWVHGLFTAVVFLTIAGSDVGLQDCFFPHASADTNQLLKNLPLGMAILSSFVFMIFPPTRKGIGFDNSDYNVIEGGVGTAKQTNDLEAAHSSPTADTTKPSPSTSAPNTDTKSSASPHMDTKSSSSANGTKPSS